MDGTDGALRLIERTTARLCQALAGPAGLLDNVPPAEAAPNPEAAKALTDQLRLWDAAWGPACHPVSLDQVTALARGLPGTVAVDVSALSPATVFPPPSGRIVLNLLLLAAESLPKGGTVVLAGAAGDLFIQINGPAAAWPTGLALCLANEAETQSALTDERNLQMALTALLAHAGGIRLSSVIPPNAPMEPPILRLGE